MQCALNNRSESFVGRSSFPTTDNSIYQQQHQNQFSCFFSFSVNDRLRASKTAPGFCAKEDSIGHYSSPVADLFQVAQYPRFVATLLVSPSVCIETGPRKMKLKKSFILNLCLSFLRQRRGTKRCRFTRRRLLSGRSIRIQEAGVGGGGGIVKKIQLFPICMDFCLMLCNLPPTVAHLNYTIIHFHQLSNGPPKIDKTPTKRKNSKPLPSPF